MKSLKKKLESLSVFMPASAGCSNCRTKYTLLTREVGCPNCGLSFCKKCLAYKSHSRKDNSLVNVCYDCYQRGEQAKMKPKTYPSMVPTPQPQATTSSSNWWGDSLPPPSLRQQIGPKPHQSKMNFLPPSKPPASSIDEKTDQLEKRFRDLKQEGMPEPSSISSIEERLAALRGCDVELIRNPRLWVEKNDSEINAKTPENLMEQAQNLAAIEEKYDPDKQLIARVNKLHEKNGMETDDASAKEDPRFSTISKADSEVMNPNEQNQFNKMLDEAEEQSKKIRDQEEATNQEMRDIMKLSRQKSMEINKVNMEFSQFWDRQINKTVEDDDSSDDNQEIDEETLKKIIKEAESAPDVPEEKTPSSPKSPSKRGFLGKLFKK